MTSCTWHIQSYTLRSRVSQHVASRACSLLHLCKEWCHVSKLSSWIPAHCFCRNAIMVGYVSYIPFASQVEICQLRWQLNCTMSWRSYIEVDVWWVLRQPTPHISPSKVKRVLEVDSDNLSLIQISIMLSIQRKILWEFLVCITLVL